MMQEITLQQEKNTATISELLGIMERYQKRQKKADKVQRKHIEQDNKVFKHLGKQLGQIKLIMAAAAAVLTTLAAIPQITSVVAFFNHH